VEHLRPLVVELDEIRRVMADVAGTLAFGYIHVDACAVDVVHEKFAAILLWPTLAQINHHACVRVPAARRRRTTVTRVRAFAARVMNMVADGLDVVVNERVDEPLVRVGVEAFVRERFLAIDVEMLAALPLEASALNHVPQMRNHAGLDEALAVFVEVNAP